MTALMDEPRVERKAERMPRHELEAEVIELRRAVRSLPRLERQAARVPALEAELLNERRLRLDAERNAKRFHALMLEARVAALPSRPTEPTKEGM